jgi:hypothetical protein
MSKKLQEIREYLETKLSETAPLFDNKTISSGLEIIHENPVLKKIMEYEGYYIRADICKDILKILDE